MALLSVIVPIYNKEKYLRRSIKSLIGQTLEDIEIILVNDGSTDKSLSICKKYAEEDSRITIIKFWGIESKKYWNSVCEI